MIGNYAGNNEVITGNNNVIILDKWVIMIFLSRKQRTGTTTQLGPTQFFFTKQPAATWPIGPGPPGGLAGRPMPISFSIQRFQSPPPPTGGVGGGVSACEQIVDVPILASASSSSLYNLSIYLLITHVGKTMLTLQGVQKFLDSSKNG